MKLAQQQRQFVDSFVRRKVLRTLLVARTGSGKTASAVMAMSHVLQSGDVHRVLVVTSRQMLVEQWRDVVARHGHRATDEAGIDPESPITVATLSGIDSTLARLWEIAPAGTRWLLILDEAPWDADRLQALVADAVARYPGSRALFVASRPPPLQVDEQFEFTSEFFALDVLEESPTRQTLQRYAPSFRLLRAVRLDLMRIDDLSWRQFEKLVAQMLEHDGYRVELMQGARDGGVDVVAVKDLGNAGLFKSVWQAKKHRIDRKIGLSLVRELADTRLEHSASKAIIVTTSYLTSGALQRVERDKYLLGKVDRDDLGAWIERILRGD